jgi:DNA-binding CsgD family transcriptional regulator
MNHANQHKSPRVKRAPAATVRGIAAQLASLTKTEYVVLLWVSEGKRDGEIAVILDRSSRTVETHVAHILGKLGVETRTAAGRLLSDHHAADGTKPPRPAAAPGHRKPKS